jgi:hypothetical protein
MMTDVPQADNRRVLLYVGLGVIVLAALFAFVILPLLGGDEETPDVNVDVGVQSEPVVEPTDDDFELAEPGQSEGGEPPAETFEVFNARDPFQQLVRQGEDGGSNGGGPGPTTPTTPASPGTGPFVTPSPSPGPIISPSPGPSGSPSPGPDSDGDGIPDEDEDADTDGDGDVDGDDGSADVGGTTVTVVDVFTDDDGERKASVTVNGTGYTVGEGDEFAGRFRLLDITGRCATMLFGDSRFTLCEGERIRK